MNRTGTVLQLRQTTIDDVPQLLRLVEEYRAFEGITGFDPALVSAQLTRLFSEPGLDKTLPGRC